MWWQKWDGLGEVVTRMRTTRIFVDGILNAVIYMDTNLTAEFVNFMHQNGPDFRKTMQAHIPLSHCFYPAAGH